MSSIEICKKKYKHYKYMGAVTSEMTSCRKIAKIPKITKIEHFSTFFKQICQIFGNCECQWEATYVSCSNKTEKVQTLLVFAYYSFISNKNQHFTRFVYKSIGLGGYHPPYQVTLTGCPYPGLWGRVKLFSSKCAGRMGQQLHRLPGWQHALIFCNPDRSIWGGW